ncbi:peptidase [Capnocytophaga sputigena]|uniref:peptidase n=1 Tax=Capnocytophaga sputigena TaxID=1019 RepID=UPI0028D7D37C|nr:peptidase [Capnocytophaga sputigena]
MKTLNKNDIQNVMDIQNLLSFDTYYTLLNENTNDEQKYKQAKREFIRRQSQLLITDGAEFICGVHKGSFRTNYQWDTINDKGIGRQCDVLPENFTFTDGFQILSIGTWQRIGSTTTFNDEYPLLFRSTIQITGKMPGNNPPETYNLQFTNAGQNFTYEDSIDEAYEQSIMGEEKNNNKQKETEPSTNCIVKFSLNENYDNLFGFDSYEVSMKDCKDKKKLKDEYEKIIVCGKEYVLPWMSLRQGATATLMVNISAKKTPVKITFDDPDSNFKFTPEEFTIQKESQSITIECVKTFTNNYTLRVLADGEIAGGIQFIGNTIKKLKFPVNWYKVVVNPTDLKDMRDLADITEIKAYCKKAFEAPLIDIEINEISTEIDISNIKTNFYNRNGRVILFEENEKTKVIEPFVKNKEILATLFYCAISRKSNQLNLFTTFLKNSDENEIVQGGDIHYHNGYTWESNKLLYTSKQNLESIADLLAIPVLNITKEQMAARTKVTNNEAICMMFLANKEIYTDVEIPHELMHALGLAHTFDEEGRYHRNRKHIFEKAKTDNYMDYDNTKKSTFKWQWDILRKSPYLKLLILAFTLLFTSCRVMSDKEIQAISCICNDTITQEDKRLPIPPPERVKNDSLDIYIIKETDISYIKYINYLKTNQRRVIEYDLEGNIKSSRLSIPYNPIGREFIFDEQGNIKEVINHDEGWKICAFQALAIAKKYAGKNYYKENPLWRLYRDGYDGKRAWLAMYKNRHYKWVYLYINSDTGKIMRKSNKEL